MSKKNNVKRISINTFDKIMKEQDTGYQAVEWHDTEILVRAHIPLIDALGFVQYVVESCFSDVGEYIPEVRDFAIKCCILEKYANFTLPQDIERRYDLIYNTDAFETVAKYIDTRQLNEIVSAAENKIEHIKRTNIEAIHKQINEAYKDLSRLIEQFGSLFEGVDPDTMAKLVGMVPDGGITPDSIVAAYIGQQTGASQEDKEDGDIEAPEEK